MLLRVKEVWYNVSKTPLHTSKWHGWLLSCLTKKCLYNYSFYGTKGNPFKSCHITSVSRLIQKLQIVNTVSVNDYVDSFFNDIPGILNVTLYDLIGDESLVENQHECIIVSFEEYNIDQEDNDDTHIQEQFKFGNNIFELRFTTITSGLSSCNNKWDGKTIFRHGGKHQSSFFISSRNTRNAIQMDDVLTYVDKCDFAVYVKIDKPDMVIHRNNFLKYMGGQSHLFCATHKLPLIISNIKEKKCYHDTNVNGCKCNKQIHLICPDAKCKTGICKSCYMTFDQGSISYLSPPRLPTDIPDTNMENTNDIDDHSSVNDDNSEDINNESFFDPIVDDDQLDDFIIKADDPDVFYDGIETDELPTTNLGDCAFAIEETLPDGQRVSGHVLLNQCGSLLDRKSHCINGSKHQKHFLQGIASTSIGNSIPLLYPEAMLFISIFWKFIDESCAMLGAIPSYLFSGATSNSGFACMKSHMNNRIRLPGTLTSTDPRYISFAFDTMSNIALNKSDSRIIINRGLVDQSIDSGLNIRAREDSNLTDEADGKHIVRRLCASQKFHQFDYF